MGHYHQSEERFYELLSRQLAKSINSAEKEELVILMQTFPELRLNADLFEQMWMQESVHSERELGEAYMRHLLKFRSDFLNEQKKSSPDHRTYGSPFIQKKWQLFVAFLFFIIMTGWILIYLNPGKKGAEASVALNTVVTRYGNKSKINLPDGSQVWLNAGSKLEYNGVDFNSRKREVYLSGEAYFDIVHNAMKPFFVRSGNMQVKVLGTTFNVKAYPEEEMMETSLIKGAVEITIKDRPDDIYILRPNEKLLVSQDRVTGSSSGSNYKPSLIKDARDIVSLKKIDYSAREKIVMETAWVQNKLVFRSEKFSDLAVKMERWYGVPIKFRNTGREDLMFTGVFTTETITQALNAMRVVQPFNFSFEDDTIYID